MRQIGSLASEAQARTFADYLLTRSIESRLIKGTDESWQIWIHREEQVAAASAEFDRFVSDPAAPDFRGLGGKARAIRREAERVKRRHYSESYDVRYFWGSRDLRRCPVAWTLILTCVFVSVVTGFGTNKRIVDKLFISTFEAHDVDHFDGEVPAGWQHVRNRLIRSHLRDDLRRGEIWRLVTPIFIHFGFLHLLFDMYWLYVLGCEIEIRRKSWRLLGLVIIAAIASNVGQYYVYRWPIFGGMSGVDLALFGYVWMKGLYDPELGMSLSRQTVMFMLLYLVFTVQSDLSIAHAAHLIGLATGMTVALLPHLVPRLRPREDE